MSGDATDSCEVCGGTAIVASIAGRAVTVCASDCLDNSDGLSDHQARWYRDPSPLKIHRRREVVARGGEKS